MATLLLESRAVTVTLPETPEVTVAGKPVTVKCEAGAGFTVIPVSEPVIEAVTVSVAEIE